jgi:hypothetical protein
MPKRTIAALVLLLFVVEAAFAGLGSDKAMYVGGTVSSIKDRTEGKLKTDDAKTMVFDYGKEGNLSVPYEQINSLEYGQKAGRRLGLAIVVNPLFLFSKKRKHFLTVGYLDADKKQQAAVFELGKGAIEPTLKALEAKTGKKVDYEDSEARKAAGGL